MQRNMAIHRVRQPYSQPLHVQASRPPDLRVDVFQRTALMVGQARLQLSISIDSILPVSAHAIATALNIQHMLPPVSALRKSSQPSPHLLSAHVRLLDLVFSDNNSSVRHSRGIDGS